MGSASRLDTINAPALILQLQPTTLDAVACAGLVPGDGTGVAKFQPMG
jgi:hypothetical protein